MGLDVSPFILKLPGSYFLLHNDKKEKKKLNRRRLLFQCGGVCVSSHFYGIHASSTLAY